MKSAPQLFLMKLRTCGAAFEIKEVGGRDDLLPESPLAETIDSGARDGLKAEFDSAPWTGWQTELQKLTAYTNDRAAVQKKES